MQLHAARKGKDEGMKKHKKDGIMCGACKKKPAMLNNTRNSCYEKDLRVRKEVAEIMYSTCEKVAVHAKDMCRSCYSKDLYSKKKSIRK